MFNLEASNVDNSLKSRAWANTHKQSQRRGNGGTLMSAILTWRPSEVSSRSFLYVRMVHLKYKCTVRQLGLIIQLLKHYYYQPGNKMKCMCLNGLVCWHIQMSRTLSQQTLLDSGWINFRKGCTLPVTAWKVRLMQSKTICSKFMKMFERWCRTPFCNYLEYLEVCR